MKRDNRHTTNGGWIATRLRARVKGPSARFYEATIQACAIYAVRTERRIHTESATLYEGIEPRSLLRLLLLLLLAWLEFICMYTYICRFAHSANPKSIRGRNDARLRFIDWPAAAHECVGLLGIFARGLEHRRRRHDNTPL